LQQCERSTEDASVGLAAQPSSVDLSLIAVF